MESKYYWLWLSSIPGIGSVAINKLMQHYDNVEELYYASETEIKQKRILNDKQLEAFIYSRNADAIARNYAYMMEKEIDCVAYTDAHYPYELKFLKDPPPVLFVRGRVPSKKEWRIAVIGARQCSAYGREIAKMFSRGMACSGVSIVSGMARGIDSAAHWGAIEAGAVTYGVLGCGVDVCYPADNMDLYEEIRQSGGLISEYPPQMPPLSGNFPKRNRLIAALSHGILVVEAKHRSGSQITIEHGLDLGKDIFAVPGRITDSLSEGCNELIRSGAKLVMEPGDILEEYEISLHEYKKNNFHLDNYEKVVYHSVCLVPRNADEIAYMTGLGVQQVMKCLISLEIKGAVNRIGKNQYILSI